MNNGDAGAGDYGIPASQANFACSGESYFTVYIALHFHGPEGQSMSSCNVAEAALHLNSGLGSGSSHSPPIFPVSSFFHPSSEHAALHRPSAESFPSSSAVLPSSGKRRRTNSSRVGGLASPNLPNSFPSDMFERVVPALPPLVFDDTALLPLSLGGQHLASAAIPTSSGVPASVSSAVLNPTPQETYFSAAAVIQLAPLIVSLLLSRHLVQS